MNEKSNTKYETFSYIVVAFCCKRLGIGVLLFSLPHSIKLILELWVIFRKNLTYPQKVLKYNMDNTHIIELSILAQFRPNG